ncbi:MAG: hypothetical protein AAF411_13885 [Myxococcota bacterium]
MKDFFLKRGVSLLQDARVQKVMQDPRVMKGMMQAMQLRGQLQDRVDARIDRVAQSLNLATKKEVRELKRNLRKMEQQLKRAERQLAQGSN